MSEQHTTDLSPEEYCARLTRVIEAVRDDPEIRAQQIAWRERQEW